MFVFVKPNWVETHWKKQSSKTRKLENQAGKHNHKGHKMIALKWYQLTKQIDYEKVMLQQLNLKSKERQTNHVLSREHGSRVGEASCSGLVLTGDCHNLAVQNARKWNAAFCLSMKNPDARSSRVK
ncbi:hypothetical protein HS088_TW21G00463 [Tripterygium wilfordii]|uniref:Uncharacterized protein n=1 Tax=Tripterygium wilfordii TaxID=458696 RepID=A0A7J7C3H6_TRIWF|nr:hypothetical protein HS088_TW21G00463 [Tripterygium wilfordii]